MPLSPEKQEHARKILMIGVGLAAGSYALRHQKSIGRKIRASGIWESGIAVAELISKKPNKPSVRVAGRVIRNTDNEIEGVALEDDREISTPSLFKLERAFTDGRLKRAQLYIAELLSRTGLYK